MRLQDTIGWVDKVQGEFAYAERWARYVELSGKEITTVSIDSEWAIIRFTDGSHLKITDDGQSCCERRWISCDDSVDDLTGGKIVSIDTDASGDEPDNEDSYEVHEVKFVKVQTTKGGFTLCTHNDHNGYYGGFEIALKLVR
jgi:hypothetical protein